MKMRSALKHKRKLHSLWENSSFGVMSESRTMCSGAEDPVYFYFNIKTETTGIGHIIKHSEDGVCRRYQLHDFRQRRE